MHGFLSSQASHVPVTEAGGEDTPIGSIELWSPLNGAIPTGWAECDGTANAPGPDLRNRFVVGRGVDKTVDTTGGGLTHTHAGHAAHIVTQPGAHTDHADNIAHSHLQRYLPTATGASVGHVGDTSMSGTITAETNPTGSSGTGAALAHSAHAGAAVDAHSAHDSPNHEPKWYALIYIQRMT